ncbi:unnamed protein product [Ectocarpus sp. 12 AP-2014]
MGSVSREPKPNSGCKDKTTTTSTLTSPLFSTSGVSLCPLHSPSQEREGEKATHNRSTCTSATISTHRAGAIDLVHNLDHFFPLCLQPLQKKTDASFCGAFMYRMHNNATNNRTHTLLTHKKSSMDKNVSRSHRRTGSRQFRAHRAGHGQNTPWCTCNSESALPTACPAATTPTRIGTPGKFRKQANDPPKKNTHTHTTRGFLQH